MLLRCIVILVIVKAKVSTGHHSNSLFHKTCGFEQFQYILTSTQSPVVTAPPSLN